MVSILAEDLGCSWLHPYVAYAPPVLCRGLRLRESSTAGIVAGRCWSHSLHAMAMAWSHNVGKSFHWFTLPDPEA